MPERSVKVFSLAEANKLIPIVAELTAEIVENLNQLRQRYNVESEDMTSSVPESALKEIERLLQEWSQRVVELGAHPKGYFTVDFRSVDPEMLYCWTYGEQKISFTHKVWENFSHRRPLPADTEAPAEHLKWVN